jgi:hypothetical protein
MDLSDAGEHARRIRSIASVSRVERQTTATDEARKQKPIMRRRLVRQGKAGVRRSSIASAFDLPRRRHRRVRAGACDGHRHREHRAPPWMLLTGAASSIAERQAAPRRRGRAGPTCRPATSSPSDVGVARAWNGERRPLPSTARNCRVRRLRLAVIVIGLHVCCVVGWLSLANPFVDVAPFQAEVEWEVAPVAPTRTASRRALTIRVCPLRSNKRGAPRSADESCHRALLLGTPTG